MPIVIGGSDLHDVSFYRGEYLGPGSSLKGSVESAKAGSRTDDSDHCTTSS